MKNNDIENLFDRLAPKWDEAEILDDETILALLKRIGIQKGDRVLDIGCGTGRITGLLHSLSQEKVVGIDLSSKMIEIAKEKYQSCPWAEFRHEDFLSSQPEEYDVLVLYNAYPHFLDQKQLNQAFLSHLKKGGRFAIIHSLSRKSLENIHHGMNESVTRHLLSPVEEAVHFEKDFRILYAEENDCSYLIIGSKW